MPRTTPSFERITISLPANLSKNIEALKKELHLSKSEILKISFEKFLQEHKKKKLQKIAQKMVTEYETEKELAEFTVLDCEDFK